MAFLPALDRYDILVVVVTVILVIIGFVVYPHDPVRIGVVFVIFSIYLGWMAYLLQRWMFPAEEGSH